MMLYCFLFCVVFRVILSRSRRLCAARVFLNFLLLLVSCLWISKYLFGVVMCECMCY